MPARRVGLVGPVTEGATKEKDPRLRELVGLGLVGLGGRGGRTKGSGLGLRLGVKDVVR